MYSIFFKNVSVLYQTSSLHKTGNDYDYDYFQSTKEDYDYAFIFVSFESIIFIAKVWKVSKIM